MTPSVTFTVPGPPVPWQRAGRGKGHSYTQDATKRYQRSIAYRFLAVRPAEWKLDQAYTVTVIATFADARRRDVDNILKTVMDALNGVAWEDDSQVRRGVVEHTLPHREGAGIVVTIEQEQRLKPKGRRQSSRV